jgi:LCP family protein required for cell wall assembly
MMDLKPRVDRTGKQLRTAQVDADNASSRHGGHYMHTLRMPDDRRTSAPSSDPSPYRVYRSGEEGSDASRRDRAQDERPYKLYRAHPRGLRARLRGEDELGLPEPGRAAEARDGGRLLGGLRRNGRDGAGGRRTLARRRITPRRVLKYLVLLIVGWLLLSLVLFIVSAQTQQQQVSDAARAALAPGGNMLTSANTVLVIGTDTRPPGSKEPGANTSDAGSRSDTLMLWRVGGGASRRLSIPRDTVAAVPGHGTTKINAAYAYGGPALAVRTVEQFTGIKINHLILVNFVNFPKFIDALGGIDVQTGRVCSDISGGTKNGGSTLNLSPGTNHLDGKQALTLARTRKNKCNPAENDLTRVKRQQQILNAIKGQLLSPGTFFRLPWVSWTAPQAIRSDMGGFTLLSLFTAAELGGSAPVEVLKPDAFVTLPDGESALQVSRSAVQQAVTKLLKG